MSIDRRALRPGSAAVLVFLLGGLLQISCAGSAAAQQGASGQVGIRVEGRVVKLGDGQPDIEVTLHRVARDSAGVVGTTRSGTEGAFAFTLPRRDTADFLVYFTTVDYLGVRYFGPALHRGDPAENYTIQIYDTVTAGAAAEGLRLVRRELILLPEESRGWEVNELLQIHNEGKTTLVPGTSAATWAFPIPAGVTDFEVGEGEISAEDVRRMDERVFITSPLQPGTREIFLRYRLPSEERSLQLPVDLPTESLNVYVRQPSPPLEVSGLTAAGTVAGDGESFLRYGATEASPGQTVRLAWQASRPSPLDPRVAAVALALLVLIVGAMAALRRQRAADVFITGYGETLPPHGEPDATAAGTPGRAS